MAFHITRERAHAEEIDLKEEAQMEELRSLLKPLAALGKTLPVRARREMQSGIRSLVEWALDARTTGDETEQDLVDLKFAAPGPGHRPGFTFIHVPTVQPRGPNRAIQKPLESELEIENKAVVYDFRTQNNRRKVMNLMTEPIIEESRQVCLPALPPSDRQERVRELEEENAVLREKVFKLIKTLSIENEKSRTRINNLQVGLGATEVDGKK